MFMPLQMMLEIVKAFAQKRAELDKMEIEQLERLIREATKAGLK